MNAFKRVVELQGFSAAARDLGLSNAAISKNISELEAHIGAQLLVRTTRRLTVTEVGNEYYKNCVDILREIEEAELTAGSNSAKPRGLLRINVPMSFGLLHLAPLISKFLTQNPEIQVDLVFNDKVMDLVRGEFDVGLRIGGAFKDSTLIAKKLSPINRVLCGAPEYFDRYGHPENPNDLQLHRCLTYSLSSSVSVWSFTGKKGRESVEVAGPLMVNNSIALREALIAGVGISMTPSFIVGKDVQDKLLIRTLPAYIPDAQALFVVYPYAKYIPQKVRAFIDFMEEHFTSNPYWEV